jgi:hypothetical protein
LVGAVWDLNRTPIEFSIVSVRVPSVQGEFMVTLNPGEVAPDSGELVEGLRAVK